MSYPHPLRLGDLSGRHLGAARCGGRVKASTCALVTHAQAAGAGVVITPCLKNALGGGALIGGQRPPRPTMSPRFDRGRPFRPWLAIRPADFAKAVHGRFLARCRVLVGVLGAARR